MKKLSSADLAEDLVRAGQGDISAFLRVYHATSAKLFGVVIRILYRRDVAEDVLQEVYLRVWQRAKDYSPDRASPITWLVAVARNKALDERRRKQPVPLDEVPDLFDIPSGEDIAADYFEGEERRRLELCLARLEKRQRQVLELVYHEGLSRDEAGERVGQTASTIRTWIRNALAVLRRCLKDG